MFNITNHKEIKIKATMRYHLIHVRMFIIKKTTKNNCGKGYREEETLMYYGQQGKLVQTLWKTVWRCLKKLKIEISYIPTIPILDIFLKNTETLN